MIIIRKRLALILAIIMTFPVSCAFGVSVAEPFYMRFIFEGARKDFAPGDAFGLTFLQIVFAAAFFVVAMFGWWRLYRAISN
jgi:hypothetical protein